MSRFIETFDKHKFDQAAKKLRALDHPIRMGMIKLINDETEINVTSIQTKLRIPEQATASQHLAILREGGYVNTRRENKDIYYSISDECSYIANVLNNFSNLTKNHGKQSIASSI